MEISRAARASGASTRQRAYVTLRASIEAVEFAPGARLSENELAERLGVSRTPIREALLGLREDRLVEIVPQLGTFVAPVTRAALEDAQFIRESLECAAVADAARHARKSDLTALRDTVARQAETRDSADLSAFLALDDALHERLCAVGGRSIAWAISQRATGHLNRVRRLSLPVPDYIAEMVAQHERVIDRVAAADPDGAREAMGTHLGSVLHGLSEIAHLHPDYFGDAADRDWAAALPAVAATGSRG